MEVSAGIKPKYFIILSALLFLGFSHWFIKINDLDFWWHIKTGEYIIEQKGLPDKDPFTFTFIENDRDMPERPAVILKSYWISQIILYLIYESSGPLGIILFRTLIFSLILLMLWKYLSDKSVSQLIIAIMLTGFIFFAKEYMNERPQIFSYLFATLVFFILEAARNGSNKSYYILPAIMLLWANMHSGYLVGIVFIIIYAICLLIKNISGKQDLRKIRIPVLIYLISVLITFLTPVTYHIIPFLIEFQGSMLEKEAIDYLSPLKIIRYLGTNWYPYFGLLLLTLAVIIINLLSLLRKRADTLPTEHVVLLVGTSIASLHSLRYEMFFMIVAIPIITIYFSRRFVFNSPALFKKWIIIASAAILIILSLRAPLFKQKWNNLIVPSGVPVKAVEFIKQISPKANIYNDVNWGGYIIWNLYPNYKVFSDTRTLNLEIYRQYLSILNANETSYFGIPEWKALLDMYSINTIIHSTVNPYSGEIYPLMLRLLKDDKWHLVYFDGIAVILVKEMSGNLVVFPKEQMIKEIYWESIRGIKRFPNHPGFLKTINMLPELLKNYVDTH
jgi:hypothetical protein